MSLLKAILHGKEHRKPFRGVRASGRTCRPHGSCDYCAAGRAHAQRVADFAAAEEVREALSADPVVAPSTRVHTVPMTAQAVDGDIVMTWKVYNDSPDVFDIYESVAGSVPVRYTMHGTTQLLYHYWSWRAFATSRGFRVSESTNNITVIL